MHNKDYDSQITISYSNKSVPMANGNPTHCLQPIKAATEPDSSYHATLRIHVQTLQSLHRYLKTIDPDIRLYSTTSHTKGQGILSPRRFKHFRDEYYFFYSTC